jgi:hypothetical protein
MLNIRTRTPRGADAQISTEAAHRLTMYGKPVLSADAPRTPSRSGDYDLYYVRDDITPAVRHRAGRVCAHMIDGKKVYRAHSLSPVSTSASPVWKLLGEYKTCTEAHFALVEAHRKIITKLSKKRGKRKSSK